MLVDIVQVTIFLEGQSGRKRLKPCEPSQAAYICAVTELNGHKS